MPSQSWYQNVASQKNAGVIFDTFTTAKTVINQQDLWSPPANFFLQGTQLRIRVRGALGTLVTTPGTITFNVMMGTIVVWTSGQIQLNATAHTLLPFMLDVDLSCQLTNTTVGGAVAKFMGVGEVRGVMFTKTAGQVDGVNSETSIVVPVTTPALGTAFDSTLAQILDFWAGFSISSASNRIQLAMYDVDVANYINN